METVVCPTGNIVDNYAFFYSAKRKTEEVSSSFHLVPIEKQFLRIRFMR